MSEVPATSVLDKLAALRVELVEQAYALERQGRLDAADVAIATSVRVAEICAELEAAVVGVKVEA
jgi:hypothetical protein